MMTLNLFYAVKHGSHQPDLQRRRCWIISSIIMLPDFLALLGKRTSFSYYVVVYLILENLRQTLSEIIISEHYGKKNTMNKLPKFKSSTKQCT